MNKDEQWKRLIDAIDGLEVGYRELLGFLFGVGIGIAKRERLSKQEFLEYARQAWDQLERRPLNTDSDSS